MANLNKDIIKKLEETSNSNEQSSFIDQDISNKQLQNLYIKEQLFKNCNFYVTSMISCIFEKCDFIDCNFDSGDMLNVKFLNCMFNKCDLTNLKLQDVLFDNCTKINCIINKLKIVNNVKGISEEESKIITEDSEIKDDGPADTYEYNKRVKNVFISIVPDFEVGSGVYRIIVGSDFEPNIISETFTDAKDIQTQIKETINLAKEKTILKSDKMSFDELLQEDFSDVFITQLNDTKDLIQNALMVATSYPEGGQTALKQINVYLNQAITNINKLIAID